MSRNPQALAQTELGRHFRFTLLCLLAFTALLWIGAALTLVIAADHTTLKPVGDGLLDAAKVGSGGIAGLVGGKVVG